MNILVTGGAGFIGSNFINFSMKKHPEDKIVCIDCLTYAGSLANLKEASKNDRFVFYMTDICDREAVYQIFEDEAPDIVFNFAAESHVDRSIETPVIFLDTNIKGTSVLLDACIKYGTKRFHQVSTDEVYGDLARAGGDSSELFTEKSPLSPSSPYSSSKAAADLLVLAYRRTYNLDVTISRCSNNYGPCQHREKLIPLMISNALENCPLPVYGDGLNIRDWIYVEDHCRAVDIIARYGRAGEIYNVGGNMQLENLQIVKMICRQLGKPESLITFVRDRKGHDRRYAIDYSKLEQELGWQPLVNFEEGLEKTVQWYLQRKT